MRNIMLHYTSAKKKGFFVWKNSKWGQKWMQNSNTYLCILHYLHHKTADFQSKQGVGGGGEVVSKLDYTSCFWIYRKEIWARPLGDFCEIWYPKGILSGTEL